MIYTTKWPLFELYFQAWKLCVSTALMRQSPESMTYEYNLLIVRWGSKELFRWRLYDTERRKEHRLTQLMQEPYDIKKLREIKKIATEEIKKLNKSI